MDLDHRGRREGVGEVEVETSCSQVCVLFLLCNSGSSYLLNLVYLGCPTVEKEYWKYVTIHTVRSCIYGRCYEHALLTSITCGRNRQNVTV